jgi:hypothetical protein
MVHSVTLIIYCHFDLSRFGLRLCAEMHVSDAKCHTAEYGTKIDQGWNYWKLYQLVRASYGT